MNFLKALRCAIPLAALTGLLPSTASAAPALPTLTSMPCSTDSFTIKTIEVSPLDGAGTVFNGTQNATKCVGLYTGNDSKSPFNNPNPNIGQLNDGLLNGQEGVLSPTWFNDPSAPSPMLDLDNNGTYTDPGWIYLGKTEHQEGGTSFVMDAYDKPLNLADILQVTMSCTGDCTQGTWSLQTSLDIIEQVQAVLGRNSFDHLAFVIKSSESFAVYDFDFNLLVAGLPGFDFTTPYSFTGTWNTDDFTNKQGNAQDFSHISVWARDPVPADTRLLPEPGSLMLLSLGLVALAWMQRLRQTRQTSQTRHTRAVR
jgi:hypothetical protein